MTSTSHGGVTPDPYHKSHDWHRLFNMVHVSLINRDGLSRLSYSKGLEFTSQRPIKDVIILWVRLILYGTEGLSEKLQRRDAWTAQWVKHLTPSFDSGHELSPVMGFTLSGESAWDPLFPCPSVPSPDCGLFQSVNQSIKSMFGKKSQRRKK